MLDSILAGMVQAQDWAEAAMVVVLLIAAWAIFG